MTTPRGLLAALTLSTALIPSTMATGADTLPPGPPYRVLAQDKGKVAIVDPAGKVEWEIPLRHTAHDIQLLPNGNILVPTDNVTIVEMTPEQKVVWKHVSRPKFPYKGTVEIHAFQRLPDGLTMVAETGNKRIIEVDAEDKIVKEIPLVVDKPNSHRDTRRARKLANGHYLVCHELDGTVREYDEAGKVVWSYRLDLAGRPATPGHEGHGTEVFNAIRRPDGNTIIAGGNNNRVFEVTPEGKVVWSVRPRRAPRDQAGVGHFAPTQAKRQLDLRQHPRWAEQSPVDRGHARQEGGLDLPGLQDVRQRPLRVAGDQRRGRGRALTMSKIRFGILSTAKIGVEKVVPAMQRGGLTEVVAIASRTEAKALQAAERLGISKAFGSYEALLADPDVDAIYNPLPNDQHVPWSIKALEAGKHVLCEKPIGLSAREGRQLADASSSFPKLKLMEAFMYRHHPQWRAAKELVESGRIGKLRTIQTFFSYFSDDPHNIRSSPEKGGGGLMDIGCYAISLSRWLFGTEPTRVLGHVEIDPNWGVDRMASAILDFGEGGSATFTCSMAVNPLQVVQVVGTEGRIELSEVPFNAPNSVPCVLRVQRGGGAIERIEVETCDQYTIQGDLFARSILDDAPVPTPIEDAIRNMDTIEAIFAAGKGGAWVVPNRT